MAADVPMCPAHTLQELFGRYMQQTRIFDARIGVWVTSMLCSRSV